MPHDSIEISNVECDPFRPSDYTGLLMHAIRSRSAALARGRGLDMGVGSGVLLATMGVLGVQELYGVDIDPDAVAATQRLLRQLGLSDRAHVRHGSLWEPVAGLRFDVVAANLPHFAATEPSDPHHSPHWSMGGANGRKWIDPFLAGLRAHLTDAGVCFMTHNVFVGLARTEAILAENGLVARTILATTAVLHPLKSDLLHPDIRACAASVGLSRLGPYEFADVQILEIRLA